MSEVHSDLNNRSFLCVCVCVLNVSANKLKTFSKEQFYSVNGGNMSPVFNMFLGSVSVFTPGFLMKLFTRNFTRLFRCIVNGVKYQSRAS